MLPIVHSFFHCLLLGGMGGGGGVGKMILEDVFQLWKVGVHCPQVYRILGYIPLEGMGWCKWGWMIQGHTDHGGSKAEISVPVTNDQATRYTGICYRFSKLCLLICNSPTINAKSLFKGMTIMTTDDWKPSWQPCQRTQWIIAQIRFISSLYWLHQDLLKWPLIVYSQTKWRKINSL